MLYLPKTLAGTLLQGVGVQDAVMVVTQAWQGEWLPTATGGPSGLDYGIPLQLRRASSRQHPTRISWCVRLHDLGGHCLASNSSLLVKNTMFGARNQCSVSYHWEG